MRRLISALMAVLFLPAGGYTLFSAFQIREVPHALVMMIFSGSLMLLLGLAGIVGLLAPERKAGEKESDDEESTAPGGGHS
ncbi:MAG: hypothetical protein LBT47_01760 [Deltaproteobacteria bacterium]|jgi:hypothetical protein|nr:hypothetical protein [Deltaproteobacteria bacterium]